MLKKTIIAITLLILTSCNKTSNPIGSIPGGDINSTALIIVPSNNEIKVFDFLTNRASLSLSSDLLPFEATISPDGRMVLVTNYIGGTISVYLRRDNGTFERINSIGNGLKPAGIIFNPKSEINQAYAVYEGESKIVILDTKNKNSSPITSKTIYLDGSEPKRIAINNDGNKIYITDLKNNRIITLSKSGDNFTTNFSESFKSEANPISLDGLIIDSNNRLYICNKAGSEVFVFDTEKNQLIKTISLQDNTITKQNIVGPRNLILYKNKQTNEQKIYVTGYDASVVSVISTDKMELIKNIPLYQSTGNSSFNPVGISTGVNADNQEMIYVSNASGYSLSIIDPQKDTLNKNISDADSIALQKPLGEIISLGPVK